MPAITFPSSSSPGARPQESGGRLINAFAEKGEEGAPSDVLIRRSPGLKYVGEAEGFTHTRGFLNCGSVALWILDDRIFSIDEDFTLTNLGVLAGSLPVTTARNNAVPFPQNVAVTDTGTFELFTFGPPSSLVAPNLPNTPTSVCDYEGYLVWSFGDGRIFASDLNSTNVQALSFNTEQGVFLRRVTRFGGRLYAFGDKLTAVYRNAGTSPFPFAREATVPRGIVGTHAVAGWETGWANELIWVGEDFRVYRIQGYTPIPVSNNAVARDIQAAVLAGDRDLIEAYVYVIDNHPFWVLSCHGRWTWELNTTTGRWNERQSYTKNNWRGMKTLRMFDEWLVGDEYNGKLYKIDGEYFREDTEHLIWHVESGVMTGFPNKAYIPRASFHLTTAVGTFDIEEDPKVEISWSLDGGHSWGEPVMRRLGSPGESRFHPYVLNPGLSRGQGIRFRLRVSDPVHVGLSGGIVDAQNRGVTG